MVASKAVSLRSARCIRSWRGRESAGVRELVTCLQPPPAGMHILGTLLPENQFVRVRTCSVNAKTTCKLTVTSSMH